MLRLLTILVLVPVARPCLGGGTQSAGSEDPQKKSASPGGAKAAGSSGKHDSSLEVRDGVVYYEGRNLDEALKSIHKDLDKAAMERDKLALDVSGKVDEKRLAELEKRVKDLEYQAGKYAVLRKKGRLLAEEQEESFEGGGKPPAQEAAAATASGPGRTTVRPGGGNPGTGTAGRTPPTGWTGTVAGPGNDPELPPQLMESQLDHSGVGRTLSGMRTGVGALEQGYKETEDGFPGGGDGPGSPPTGGRGAREGARARAPGFDGADVPQNLSDPATPQDLVLAAMAGYRGSLGDLGLKVGTGPDGRPAILRLSGSPAEAGELRALRERIRSEPRALLQRPDFFQVLQRPRHAELKRLYGAKPAEDKAFRHIALASDERDFLWSATCAKLSGDCNRHIRSASYSRGQFVPPEDLRAVYQSLDDDGEWVLDDDSDLKEARDKLSRRAFGGAGGLRGLLASIGKVFSGGEVAPASSAGAGASVPFEARVQGGPGTGDRTAAGDGTSRGRGKSSVASAGPSTGHPPPVPRRSAPGNRWGFWIAAAAAALFLIRFGLSRRPASRG